MYLQLIISKPSFLFIFRLKLWIISFKILRDLTKTTAMAFSMASHWPQITCSNLDADHMLKAAEIADKSAGLTPPHPNCGCIIARGAKVVSEGFLYAHGTKSAEIQAVEKARELSKGATAYLNLEPSDPQDDDQSALSVLYQAGVTRVVIGLTNPLKNQTGKAINALRNAGMEVHVLAEELPVNNSNFHEALKACRTVNAPLLYRTAYEMPFSTLKYAMTLDGKIAATGGHAAWVSSHMSRKRVFEMRGRSDAVVVGGNTVRKDDPLLTTRKEIGHLPIRIVMSATLDLPENAKLWDVSVAPTIVATLKTSRKDFQQRLADKGVEVVGFDLLTPKVLMDYCYKRGFLSVLWECGGTLSAVAIGCGVVHKVMAFVAPKIIGGVGAPSPVEELGIVKMTDAINLADVSFEQIGPDMLISGYLHPFPS
eukprot:Gb_11351 [translate_table: standard]